MKIILTILWVLCGREYSHLNQNQCYNRAKKCIKWNYSQKFFWGISPTKKAQKIFKQCTEDLQ